MRRVISFICLGLLLVILGGDVQLNRTALTINPPNGTAIIPGWKLIFHDEFHETSLDTKKWNSEDSARDGYQNCCLGYGTQYFTPKALSFRQGSLRITAQQQFIDGYGPFYTSGAITTENKFSFLYGRVDIRARVPRTRGFWPALWLLPNHSVGIAPFEIDMMEIVGNEPTIMHMANHWGREQHKSIYIGPDFSQEYHVFSIIWTHQAIDWYIDGVQRFESKQGLSDQSMYLIINSTIGGSWTGNPDRTTIFPQYMDIDYVRVYQPASTNLPSVSR